MIEPSGITSPKGSEEVGPGYVLLCQRERTPYVVYSCEADAILRHLASNDINIPSAPPVTKCARLCLPNGQVAHSAWKEHTMSIQPRMARNIKLLLDRRTAIAEVYFYFNMMIHSQHKTFAIVSEYSDPHQDLLQRSFHIVFICQYHGDALLKLTEVSTIQSVVAMVPHQFPDIDSTLFYLIECPGLDIIMIGGINEEDIPDED
ncbi:hypothetical protein EDD22DRAFT_783536 [Suillus occidentalis]|nr:hypothetical protein EDD22DRAFT_783536 [Suillus occidentalis]